MTDVIVSLVAVCTVGLCDRCKLLAWWLCVQWGCVTALIVSLVAVCTVGLCDSCNC